MQAILDWGLELIRMVQAIRTPSLDALFETITTLGNEEFYLLLLPLLLWVVDFRFAVRLGVVFLVSSYLNTAVKDLLMQPRPCLPAPEVCISEAEGFGLPSGHAQSAVVVWGMLARRARQPWFWALAGLLMLAIGFSRVYLGVHFPSDVLVGWGLGAGLLAVYVAWGERIEGWVSQLGTALQILLAVSFTLLLFAIHPVKDTASALAALAGVGIGLALLAKYGGFDAGGPAGKRALRFVVGVLVVVALYAGLRLVLPDEGEALYLPFRLLRYGLIGLWVSLGGPLTFRGLRLAEPATR